MIAVAGFLLGAIIGSFLNVVILRRGLASLQGRSACLSCDTQLRWYDMIPIVSWLALRGRCRDCGSSISFQYPIVEMVTAALFAALAASPLIAQPHVLLLSFAIASLLVCIAGYDMRHTIIPDTWAYLFAALALAYAFLAPEYGAIPLAMKLAAGPLAALPIAALWAISGGTWIGLGDAKLCLGIGWLLGPYYGVSAVFFAFIIGAVVSVCVLLPLPHVRLWLSQRGIVCFRSAGAGLTMKSEVPFGPFLIASTFFIWFSLLFNVNLPFPW